MLPAQICVSEVAVVMWKKKQLSAPTQRKKIHAIAVYLALGSFLDQDMIWLKKDTFTYFFCIVSFDILVTDIEILYQEFTIAWFLWCSELSNCRHR